MLSSLIAAAPTSEPAKISLKSSAETTTTKLGNLVEIRIGAVTGDSDYFLMTQRERRQRNIPATACVPVLTRSSHLRSSTITRSKWANLRDSEERIWLFRPNGRDLKRESVQRYLALPDDKGGCQKHRFKIQIRKPWHRTPLPTNVDGFLSGMSSAGPWIAISQMPSLSATNTLYVVTFKKAKTLEEKSAVALSLLSTTARQALSSAARRYADGLLKYEPGDLKEIQVPIVTRTKGVLGCYRQALSKLLDGDVVGAQQIADEWVLKNPNRDFSKRHFHNRARKDAR